MLHCKVAMLLVIDAMSPAAAGAVPLTPWQKNLFNTQDQYDSIIAKAEFEGSEFDEDEGQDSSSINIRLNALISIDRQNMLPA